MCNYTVYSLVDQQEEQQVNNPRKSNFSLPYTNQSLSVHSLPKAQTLADSSLEQLPPHPRWSQLACTASRPTLLFSSLKYVLFLPKNHWQMKGDGHQGQWQWVCVDRTGTPCIGSAES